MSENSVEVVQSSGMPAQTIPDQNVSVQVSTAKKYPRDIQIATKNCISLATSTKEAARSCLYCRPVGKDYASKKMKFATGPSIRLAEIIRSEWGNLKVGTHILEEMDGYARVRWVAYDLEKNVENTGEVTKCVLKKNGERYSDNQVQVIMLALQSIAQRNAILSIVPRAFAEKIIEDIETMMVGNTDKLADTWQTICNAYARININKGQLMALCEVEEEKRISKKNCVFLLNIMNIIKDGICAPTEIFPDVPGKATVQKKKPAPKKKPTPKPTVEVEVVPAVDVVEAEEEIPLPDESEAPAQEKVTPEDSYADKMQNYMELLGISEEQCNDVITAEWSIPTWQMVPEDTQQQVLNHFEAQL